MENEENKKHSDVRVGHVGPSTEDQSYRGLNPPEIWRDSTESGLGRGLEPLWGRVRERT